jgi:hypothetical protein
MYVSEIIQDGNCVERELLALHPFSSVTILFLLDH